MTGQKRFHIILRKAQKNEVLPVDMTNLGADFKKARESKGISLDQIATATRIRIRFLTAIENEAFHLLPGGIFNRGFVRTYAERVGIDPDQAVTDYGRLAEVREPAEASPAKIERHLHPVAVGALVLLIVIFYVVTRESGNTAQTASAPPAPVSQPAALPPPPTTAPETTSVATTPEPEPAPPATKEALAIEMEAKETTWIKVTADGNSVNPGEMLKRGMTRRFTAQTSIDLIIGNADGLTLKINDQQSKPLGRSGQVRELNITSNNLKEFIGYRTKSFPLKGGEPGFPRLL